MKRALVLGCNGILGRSMVSQLRAREGWHIIGADVSHAGAKSDEYEMLQLSGDFSNWADDVKKTSEALPELDLVVSRYLLTSPPTTHR